MDKWKCAWSSLAVFFAKLSAFGRESKGNAHTNLKYMICVVKMKEIELKRSIFNVFQTFESIK